LPSLPEVGGLAPKTVEWRDLTQILRSHFERSSLGTLAAVDAEFRAEMVKSPAKGGWTYVVMPGSAEHFGTRGLVKVEGTIDGLPFRSSFMAMGDGRHMLPVKADVRKAIGKDVGDLVIVKVTTVPPA
jgi:hypothetical protein